MNILRDKSKRTGLMFIVVAIILAFVVAAISFTLISSVTKKSPVLVLNVELQKGDPISKEKFKVVNIPTGSIIKGTMNPKTDLTGYVAAIPMTPGEVLKSSQIIKLSENNEEIPLLSARLKALDDPNLVAGEIPIDSVKGMLGGMKSSDKISIVNVYKRDTKEKEKELISETLIPYADVVGLKTGEDGSSLVVAITHEQSKILAAGRERGKVYAYLLPYGVKKEEIEALISAEVYKTQDSAKPTEENKEENAEDSTKN